MADKTEPQTHKCKGGKGRECGHMVEAEYDLCPACEAYESNGTLTFFAVAQTRSAKKQDPTRERGGWGCS